MENGKYILPIGYIRNQGKATDKPGYIKDLVSEIILNKELVPGTLCLNEHEYITVIFGLDKISEVHLLEKGSSGKTWGIFACRSPYRPNHLGMTFCKIIEVNNNIIKVTGLDACNETPVYDIKCPDSSEFDLKYVHDNILIKDPRHDIKYYIRNDSPFPLILKAGQITGNINSDLAIGVVAGMRWLYWSLMWVVQQGAKPTVCCGYTSQHASFV